MMTFEQFLEARTKTSFRTPTNIEQQVVSLRQQGYKTSQIIQHLAQQGVALNRRTLTRILNRVQAEPGQSIDQPRYVAARQPISPLSHMVRLILLKQLLKVFRGAGVAEHRLQ